jgi:hypothetical protein
VDRNLTSEYNGSDLLLLHHVYDHTPNAPMPPPSTTVGDIDNDERRPAGRDGPEGGEARRLPTAAAIVVVIVVDDGGGGVGADDQYPMPHAAEGRPADHVATVVVGFPPIFRSPA